MESINFNNKKHLISNNNNPSHPPKRSKFASPNTLREVKESITKTSNIIRQQLHKLEFEQKKISTNDDGNIQLVVLGETINTTLSSTAFIENFMLNHEMDPNSLLTTSCEKNKRLIFRHNHSKKRNRQEVKIYFDDMKKEIGSGGLATIRKIVRVGSDKEKAMKEVKKIKHNLKLDAEIKMLQIFHQKLPHDPFLSPVRKNLKHLGLQDAYTFGRMGGKNKKSFFVGKLFEADGFDFELKGITKALSAAYQLAFGLTALEPEGFNHDLKPENTLFENDENFPGGLRVVLSDLEPVSRKNLKKFYAQNKFNFKSPFETITDECMPKEDLEEMHSLGMELKSCILKIKNFESDKKYLNTVENIFHLRQKNMVCLLGQSFALLLGDFWKRNNWNKETRGEELQRKLTKDLKNNLFKKLVSKKEIRFCDEFAALIMDMTELDYKVRPTPKEVLSKVLNMVKDFDPDQYEMIVKNRWTNGYADWN